jgi:hypothetical protein
MKSVPVVTYNELSIKAKCANNLDSIGAEPKTASKGKKKAISEGGES